LAERMQDEIIGRGLKALLMSNPCNPKTELIMYTITSKSQ